MSLLKNRSARIYAVFFFILSMTIGGAAIGAFADSGGATATVHAGTLTEAATYGETVSATLDGTDQTVTYTLPITVKDVTGSGAGWNLQLAATALTDGMSGHAALTQEVTAASETCPGTGPHCSLGTSSTPTYPLVLTTTAQKFYSANTNSGMGTLSGNTTIGVVVPADAYAGTYSTTLTVSIVSGP